MQATKSSLPKCSPPQPDRPTPAQHTDATQAKGRERFAADQGLCAAPFERAIQAPSENLRRRNRDRWAALDFEVNRTPGQTDDTRAAVAHLIRHCADIPWSAFEQGLQSALAHAARTGNVQVTRGIARAVVSSQAEMLTDERKLAIVSAHSLAQRSRLQLAGGRANASATPSTYRSAYNRKRPNERSLRAPQVKKFVPALGAFVEEEFEEDDETDEFDMTGRPAQPLRLPLLQTLFADPPGPGNLSMSLLQTYACICGLFKEVAWAQLNEDTIKRFIASEHLTALGQMTWAQVAMQNGHPVAVGYAMVGILELPINGALKSRLIGAFGVSPGDLIQALQTSRWTGTVLIDKLVRTIEERMPARPSEAGQQHAQQIPT